MRLDAALPDATVGALRTLYASPSDPLYWEALGARIMARLASQRTPQWWQILDDWARAGLVAAAALLAVVGALLMHTRTAELRAAYDAVATGASALEAPTLPAGALSEHEGPDVREVTFRDVISQ